MILLPITGGTHTQTTTTQEDTVYWAHVRPSMQKPGQCGQWATPGDSIMKGHGEPLC